MRVLAVRTVRFYLRNPELVLAKVFTYTFMGCFMGAPAAAAHTLPFRADAVWHVTCLS